MNKPMIYEPKSTGTDIPRDIRDRFADILNVKDYGAIGDGNTNDTQAFKNAKSAANTKNTVVYVPYGTYKITENITDNQSDISANAHTFLTDGHVTITGGGSVNVLDLSKTLTREDGVLTTSNINSNGPVFLNSSNYLDFREGNGLERNTKGGKQYIDIKPVSNGGITVTSEGISADFSKIPVSAPITNTSGTIGFNPGTNSPVTITSDGKLGLNVGAGLEVTSEGILNCTVSSESGEGSGSSESIVYSAGNGIDITSNTISAKVDNTTIDFNTDGALSFIGSLNGLTVSDIPYMQGASNTLFAKQVDFGNMLLMYGVSQIGTGTHNLVITDTDPFNVPYDSSFPNGSKLEPTFYVSFSGQLAHAGWIYDSGVYGFKLSNTSTESEITTGKNYFWFGFGPKIS